MSDVGPEYRETCSGHGKDIAGRCRCSPLYSGHKCQYRDECSEDKDCGRHGKCFHLEGATSFPKRQCFCEMGWFGPLCNKRKFLFLLNISYRSKVSQLTTMPGMASSQLTLDARTNSQLVATASSPHLLFSGMSKSLLMMQTCEKKKDILSIVVALYRYISFRIALSVPRRV